MRFENVHLAELTVNSCGENGQLVDQLIVY